jgi:hypothetical protein
MSLVEKKTRDHIRELNDAFRTSFDVKLGLVTYLDGATTTTISIDTTKPGTHTILYTVTDRKGLIGTATRTVIVSPAEQPSTPAANDNASSTVSASSTLLAI